MNFFTSLDLNTFREEGGVEVPLPGLGCFQSMGHSDLGLGAVCDNAFVVANRMHGNKGCPDESI